MPNVVNGRNCDDIPDLVSDSGSDVDDDPGDCDDPLDEEDDFIQSLRGVFMMSAHPVVQRVFSVLDLDSIVMDGGATICATPNDSFCCDVTDCNVTIAGVGGVAFTCRRRGSMWFQSASRTSPIKFTNVHIAPEFPATFLSESVLVRKGCIITKCSTGGTVVSAELGHLCDLEERNGLFFAVGHLIRAPDAALLLWAFYPCGGYFAEAP
jgi:hypothetical protein